jgi:hypothetical protein
MRRWLIRGAFSLLTVAALLAGAFLVGKGGAAFDQGTTPTSALVTAYPLPIFNPDAPAQTRFGPLAYLGGLELRSPHAGFGGISAIRINGEAFIAVSDVGDWITGRITARDGVPTGLGDVMIGPVLLADGRRAKDLGQWDTESIAFDGSQAYVGIERQHSILGFDFGKDGIRSRGRAVPVPDFVKDWPQNRGIEALGFLPAASPYAGRLIGLSERSSDKGETSDGFVMKTDGSEPFRFSIRRSGGFDVTDLDFLPNGDLILLERFFSPLRGVGMRLRRIKTSLIQPDAVIEPEILLAVDNSHTIDNMEGMSIHQDSKGETFVTLIADDNFSIAQRTLLLRFRWIGD